jgi:hypothetical protein
MNAAMPAGSPLWRLLTRPIGPTIFPRRRPLRKRPATVASVVGAAGLPAELERLVTATADRTRLWQRERAEIAAELVAHFAGGLEAGRTPAELTAEFGNPEATARLMRRARLRGRPRLWRWSRAAAAAFGLAAGLTGALVGIQVVRFAMAEPAITHNYLADLNAPSLAIPESERAWPLYHRAALAAPPTNHALDLAWGPATPTDPWWPDLIERVRQSQTRLSLIHEAAQRPHFGLVLSDVQDREVWAKRGVELPERPSAPFPELRGLDLGPSFVVRSCASSLSHEACVAASSGDAGTVLRDLSDMVAIAEHFRQAHNYQGQASALAVYSMTLDTAGTVLQTWPRALSDEDWTAAAHILAHLAGGGPVRLNFDDERPFVLDLAQRLYTSRGAITPAGFEFLTSWSGQHTIHLASTIQKAGHALEAARRMPSRDEFVGEYERAIAAASEEAARPLFQRAGRSSRDPIFETPRAWTVTFWSTAISAAWFPAQLRAINVTAEQVTQRRDAVVAAIALELYRRRHAALPASLSELTPALLPAVPVDRYDGKPLKYLVRDGTPVLYSVGTNRVDDGGRPPRGTAYAWRYMDWVSPERLAVRLQSPGVSAGYDGDWILWPMSPDRPGGYPAEHSGGCRDRGAVTLPQSRCVPAT